MQRRHFLLAAVATPLLLGGAVTGTAHLRSFNLNELLSRLENLQQHNLTSTGQWSVSEVFQHCTQSIQGSLTGYPLAFSPVFQHSVGPAALAVFRSAGAMRHNLAEMIPGAEPLNAQLSPQAALENLIHVLTQFMQYEGDLAPHFAYGQLDKTTYSAAHYLHIQNHLREIVAG